MSLGASPATLPAAAMRPAPGGLAPGHAAPPLPAWLRPWLGAARWRRPGTRPVVLGSLALLAGVTTSLLLVPRWQAETRAAGQALHQRAITARRAPPPRPPEPGPAQRLQAALPPADHTALRLAELLALAQRHGITVASARQSPPSASPGTSGTSGTSGMNGINGIHGATASAVTAVPLAWRAQGRYADLRAFVAAALQADPGLVLDQLRLSRTDGRAALLDADLQWQLLMQPQPPTNATNVTNAANANHPAPQSRAAAPAGPQP